MQDFEVNPTTGKAKHNKDPSFDLVTVDMGENRSEDVGLTVVKRRVNKLENIRDLCFECTLFSLMHPGQDFFKFVIILWIPGMKKLD